MFVVLLLVVLIYLWPTLLIFFWDIFKVWLNKANWRTTLLVRSHVLLKSKDKHGEASHRSSVWLSVLLAKLLFGRSDSWLIFGPALHGAVNLILGLRSTVNPRSGVWLRVHDFFKHIPARSSRLQGYGRRVPPSRPREPLCCGELGDLAAGTSHHLNCTWETGSNIKSSARERCCGSYGRNILSLHGQLLWNQNLLIFQLFHFPFVRKRVCSPHSHYNDWF